MPTYSSELTLREARHRYIVHNNFGDGGYTDRWVKVEWTWLRFYFPNTQARAEVVRYHDLHHVLTEYETSMPGETEISAWEIATGCTRNYAAWILNLLGFGFGLFINPRRVYKSFLRGRYSTNLYSLPFDNQLLDSKVGDMRHYARLDRRAPPPTSEDQMAFSKWAFASAVTLIVFDTLLLVPLTLVVWLLIWLWRA